jgi:trehalose 6-phosphate synthase
MDYTKGILHRIEAIERFLEELKDRDAIKFIFVSVPSREGVEQYQELRAEVEARIGRINGTYATLRSSRFVSFTVRSILSISARSTLTPTSDWSRR